MAIAEMKKLELVGMTREKDDLLNLLQKTGAVEIVDNNSNSEKAFFSNGSKEEVSKAISILSEFSKSGFLSVGYNEFMSYSQKEDFLLGVAREVIGLKENVKNNNSLLIKTYEREQELSVYGDIDKDFSSFKLKKFKTFFGSVKKERAENLKTAFAGVTYADYYLYSSPVSEQPVFVLCDGAEEKNIEGILTANAFKSCPFTQGSGKSELEKVKREEEKIKSDIARDEESLKELSKRLDELKVFYDYLMFVNEKKESGEKMSYTDVTFSLKAFVPTEEVQNVEEVLNEKTNIYYEFSSPTADDQVPVLMKNNKVVKNFESVTNLYSPPSYREFDPNTIMSIFFSLFLGYITADFAYGVIMIIIAFVIHFKNGKRDNGITRLFWVIGYGGIFAMLWGILFNSYFGLALPFYKALMPNPQDAYWNFIGIRVPANLIISMLLGIVHLTVGYCCKAVQEWRRGNFFDGLIDGIVWGVFMIGLGMLIVAKTDKFGMDKLTMPSVYVLVVSLSIAVLFAGRKEKFFGKFTKGFSAVYGVINFLSDILSYARLYGLMLSGVILGGLVSNYCVDFIHYFTLSWNVVWLIGAILLFVIGHAFNLAMGLLGAYIHDSRLQYVEFFSRFFEGEGELFKPLGYDRVYSVQIKQKT